MDFAAARRNMIECQLRANRITDERLLSVMGEAPRERFLPASLQPVAYVDEDLEIAPGRCLMEPVVLATMIQEAEIADSDVVLVVGSGAGYAVAVLSRLAGTVFALESDEALAAQAAERYAEIAPDNVVTVEGRLVEGCPEHAPFDVIMIEGSVEHVPDTLTDQLSDGGRLVATVVDGGVGRITITTRRAGHFSRRVVSDAHLPRLPEFDRPSGFTF